MIFFCVFKPQIFHIASGLDQDLDPNTLLSLMSIRGPRPKGQGWNMTYAADVMVVGDNHQFTCSQTLLVHNM